MRDAESKLMLFVFEVCKLASVVVSNTEIGILEWIVRRQSSDVFHFINSSGSFISCYENTYLISEDQCVKDQELFRGSYSRIYKF